MVAYALSSQQSQFGVRGRHPEIARLSRRSTNTHTDSGSGLLPVRSPLLGNLGRFLFLGYLDVSVPPVRLINLWIQLMIV